MKKLIGIVGLSMAFASSALAAPAEGTTAIGLNGNVHVTPGDLSVALGGSYTTFIQDGVGISAGADLGLMPDVSVGINLGASYWMELNDDMDFVAGLSLGMPGLTDGLTLGASIDCGIAYWLGDNYAVTVTNVLGLGSDLLGAGVAITDDIVLGTAVFF